nr:hypothetical protein GCM10017745_36490 [Saccharothrix mutabilis subsp. capreolus]
MIEASPEAQLVAAFANTVDLEDETDVLASAPEAAGWLLERGLVDRPVALTREEHRMLLDLRAGVRDALGSDGPSSPHVLAVANAVLRDLPVLVFLSADPDPQGPPPRHGLRPDPALPAARKAMGVLAIAWSEVAVTGQAQRLKRCADETCGWVFWDVSRNHSRRWCTMRVCGNRRRPVPTRPANAPPPTRAPDAAGSRSAHRPRITGTSTAHRHCEPSLPDGVTGPTPAHGRTIWGAS